MSIKKNLIILSSLITLSGCSAFMPATTDSAFKYLGVAKGVADVATYKKTGKTINDHLLSAAIGKDCKLTNVLKKQPVCVEIDPRTHKYSIYNKGKVISKNNVVDIQFPSEIYDFNKTLENDLKKKLQNTKIKLF